MSNDFFSVSSVLTFTCCAICVITLSILEYNPILIFELIIFTIHSASAPGRIDMNIMSSNIKIGLYSSIDKVMTQIAQHVNVKTEDTEKKSLDMMIDFLNQMYDICGKYMNLDRVFIYEIVDKFMSLFHKI
jgi:hypothetical protein